MTAIGFPAQAQVLDPSFRTSFPQGELITIGKPIDYGHAWRLQQRLHSDRVSGRRVDTLILLQHLPVYTVGRRTKPGHVRQDHSSSHDNVPIESVTRGGSVTYHGPGQLVAYPILALSRYAPGPKTYVRMLEEVLLRTLARSNVNGYRVTRAPGVWTGSSCGEVKIASIGARVELGVTLHGFALNVDLNLSPFFRIVPCGLDGCRMTSMAEIARAPVSLELVGRHMAESFSSVFQLEWRRPYPGTMMPSWVEEEPTISSSGED
ncbi:MAG TPA: lipoyl(octanoyl) transferase LipB [Nitrospira sp.]|nr:lipoyl(octanoyl) transferase LipB [Nitrospira sp.]